MMVMTMDAIIAHGTSIMYISAFITLLVTILKPAPYGRYTTTHYTIPAHLAWTIFESPNLLIPPTIIYLSNTPLTPVTITLLTFFITHYIHRTLIYPLRLPPTATPTPIIITLTAFIFCVFNATLQTLALLHYPHQNLHLLHPRFLLGMATALSGMVINIHADSTLLTLRRSRTYQIPYGTLFTRISCPNFLGEILEWVGWATACWSPAAASFALYTLCNIAPRARSHHHFYRTRFDDYPKERYALLPFVF